MFAKKTGRVSFRNKRSNYRKNTNSYSSSYLSNKPRAKGNAVQLHDKYSKLAKEAFSSGDKTQSEYYYQFADHYFRLMNELEQKSFNAENSLESINQTIIPNEDKIKENNEDKIKENKEKNISVDEIDESENSLEESSESIEKVSFIAQPAKKKSIKSTKELS